MSSFSAKDFFGDPLWPTDFDPGKSKEHYPDKLSLIYPKKLSFNLQPNQNSSSLNSLLAESQEAQDIEKSYLDNEQKMACSNFKQSEATYLGEHNKGFQFSKDDIQSHQNASLDSMDEDSQNSKAQKSAQLKLQQQFFSLPNPSQSSSSGDQMSDEEQSYDQYKRQNKKSFNKKYNKIQDSPKVKIQQPDVQIEQIRMIEQLINEYLEDKDFQKVKTEEIESTILKKLDKINEEENKKKEKKRQSIKKKKILYQRQKNTKYKILSESQKQYLVYLSTLTTTCQVARKFNISVNNICRWKKGCKRKIGAGRKITNQELEQKVVLYVKSLVQNGETFTRKHIQDKARELSQSQSFKASKGWFERFYNRNIGIFTKNLQNEKQIA